MVWEGGLLGGGRQASWRGGSWTVDPCLSIWLWKLEMHKIGLWFSCFVKLKGVPSSKREQNGGLSEMQKPIKKK